MRSIRSPSSNSDRRLPGWLARLTGSLPVPVPPHAFLLDAERLRYGYVARDRQGLRLRAYRERPLPPDAFANGVLGGPLRDPAAFGALVAELVAAVPGGIRDGSLVLPDAWLRVAFSESGDLPRSAQARDEVLRWKLKRLVPFRVEELRVSAAFVTPLPGQEEPRRLLLGFAVEQLLAQLEDAFAGCRVHLGQVTNVSLALLGALATRDPDAFSALVVVEGDAYTVIFARGGEPVLYRYKSFADELPEAARSGLVVRDLKLTRNFLDEHFPGTALGRVLLLAPPELEPAWLDRLEGGLEAQAAPLDGRHLPPLRVEEAAAPSWRDMAPLLGAARTEVA